MSKRINTDAVKTVEDVINLLDILFHQMPDETIDILVANEPSLANMFTDRPESP